MTGLGVLVLAVLAGVLALFALAVVELIVEVTR